MKQFGIDKRRYIQLYALKNSTHRQNKMTPEQAAELTELEKHHSFETVVMFRGLASAYIEKDREFVEALKEKRREEDAARTAEVTQWISEIVMGWLL